MTMDLSKLREPFPEECIEWRIGPNGKTASGKVWAHCLAYIQARAVMDRLDEVVGPQNWKVEYTYPPGGTICRLSIKIGKSLTVDGQIIEWITKEDGSEASDIEPFKGAISGALKRAGSAWGIGRYLYGLETGFANIVADRNTPGAMYGKTKEGEVFYWTPPALPDWALPKDKTGGSPKVVRETVAAAGKNEQSSLSQPVAAPVNEAVNVANDPWFPPEEEPAGPAPTKCRCGGKLLKSKYAPELYCEKYKDKSKGEHTKVPL